MNTQIYPLETPLRKSSNNALGTLTFVAISKPLQESIILPIVILLNPRLPLPMRILE